MDSFTVFSLQFYNSHANTLAFNYRKGTSLGDCASTSVHKSISAMVGVVGEGNEML